MIQVVFAIELALLFAHEMDAIRRQEWKMFIILKGMEDEKAYHAFLLLHVPLYAALLWLLLSGYRQIGYYITDIFLIAHLVLHGLFIRHPANRLNGRVSRLLIVAAGLLGVVHLALLVMQAVWT